MARRSKDDRATLAALTVYLSSQPTGYVFHGRAHVLAALISQQSGGLHPIHSLGRVVLALNPDQPDSRFRIGQTHMARAGDLRARLTQDLRTADDAIATPAGYRAIHVSLTG